MTCGFPSSGRAFTRLWRVGTLTSARVLPDTAARAVRFAPELPCQLRVFTQSLLFIRPILRVKSRCRRHFPGLVLEGHAEAGCGQRSGRGQRGLQAERPLLFTRRCPIPAPACGRTCQLRARLSVRSPELSRECSPGSSRDHGSGGARVKHAPPRAESYLYPTFAGKGGIFK